MCGGESGSGAQRDINHIESLASHVLEETGGADCGGLAGSRVGARLEVGQCFVRSIEGREVVEARINEQQLIAQFLDREERLAIVVILAHGEGGIIDHHIAKLRGDIELAVGERHMVDTLVILNHRFLDVGDVILVAIGREDINIGILIGNHKIVLVVVVINARCEHVGQVVSLVD